MREKREKIKKCSINNAIKIQQLKTQSLGYCQKAESSYESGNTTRTL